jgi:PAS domain S-box-containing protein
MSHRPTPLIAGPQHMLETAPIPIMRAGVDGVLKYANTAALPLLRAWQCEPGETLSDPAYSLVRAAVVSGHSGSVEYSLGERVYALRCGPVDKHGVPLFATDISGIVHAESVMVESGEMLIGILAAAPVVLISIDQDRSVSVYADAGMSVLNGQASTLGELLPYQTELTTTVEAAFAGEVTLPTSLIAATEEDRIFSLNISGVRDESGDVVRLLIAGMDVTERHRHVRQIEQREVQYRSIFDTVGDGLVILSAAGRIVDANPSACTLFRTQIGSLIGRRLQAFVHPDGHDFLRTTLDRLKSDRRSAGDVTAIRADGQSFDADVVIAPFNYRGERHILAVVRDVSEQRANRRALEDLNQSLETLVAERTYALPVGPAVAPARRSLS